MPERRSRDEHTDLILPARTYTDATAEALRPVDRVALTSMQEALLDGRATGDPRPSFAILADSLCDLGIELPQRRAPAVSLEQAKQDWLRRLRSANRGASSISAYRVALDDLLSFLDRAGATTVFCEETVVAYLDDYRHHQPGRGDLLPPLHPAPPLLPLAQPPLRRTRSVSRPRAAGQAAAGSRLADQRRVRSTARRSRRPLATPPRPRRARPARPAHSRLDRAAPLRATRARLARPPPRLSAHTLRHTAATWLRQQTGDARLVAAYLGHADLSTVSRYAHVADSELHRAATALAESGGIETALAFR